MLGLPEIGVGKENVREGRNERKKLFQDGWKRQLSVREFLPVR